MRIALVQSDYYWEDISANLSMLEEKIWKIDGVVDIIILPEMFTTGFTLNAPPLAEPMNFTTHKWMKQIASQTQAAVCGSFIVKDGEKYYNRFLWVQPDGFTHSYDKRHLFSYANEEKIFTQGNSKTIITWRGWTFLPLICYDLRFPVWSRHTRNESYECLIYVANWPQKREIAWNTLLKARAIENVCYSLGVNRIGIDGNSLYYSGDTSAYNFQGNKMADAASEDTVLIVELDKEQLNRFRTQFSVLDDADHFTIQ